MTTIFSSPAATTLFVFMMTPKGKLLKPKTKVHSRQDYFSILPIRKMTKSHSCNTIKNWAKVLKINSLWQQFIIWEAITNKQLKFTRNCYLKAESTKPSMFTSHCVTTRWNIMMWVLKFCRGMKHSIPRVFSLPISRPVTTTKFILVRMLKKYWDQFNKSLKVEIFSRKVIFWDTIWLFSEADKMPCKSYLR